jgi:uncharacterized protein DUF5753
MPPHDRCIRWMPNVCGGVLSGPGAGSAAGGANTNDVFSNELPGFEAGASQIRTFGTAFIPGLLQVPAYIELITDPAIRRAQLSHLTGITSRPNTEVQILPFAAGVYPVTGEVFTCLSFPDPSERDFIYLSNPPSTTACSKKPTK